MSCSWLDCIIVCGIISTAYYNIRILIHIISLEISEVIQSNHVTIMRELLTLRHPQALYSVLNREIKLLVNMRPSTLSIFRNHCV